MALTIADGDRIVPFENRKMVIKTVTFDASYPTGGEELTVADMDLSAITAAWVTGFPGGYLIEFDHENELLVAYWTGTSGGVLDEVDNATDLSAVTVTVVAVGI